MLQDFGVRDHRHVDSGAAQPGEIPAGVSLLRSLDFSQEGDDEGRVPKATLNRGTPWKATASLPMTT